ncbi:MAG: TPM domain-containing protein [Candidatus Eremiobacteraeota bacterium]|nr:TPM domain-containing protein [Candidatus Eremiobacteraeota bacterium]
MTTRVYAALLILLAFGGGAAAAAAEFQVPTKPTQFVTDNVNALSSGTRSSVDGELRAYEQATGHQVIVWIGDTTGDVPLETFTTETAHEWKVGRRGHDDGAILFLFMKDHHIRIEVGYGLESSLTDADSYRIIQDVIRPRMRAGNVDAAVSSGVAAMIKTITPSYSAVSPPPSASENTAPPVVGGIVIAFFAMFALFMAFIAVMIVVRIIGAIRYGYLVLREGPKKAKADMKNWAFAGGATGGFIGSAFSGGGGGDDFGGGDFSGGGGDFGGGGASGSW